MADLVKHVYATLYFGIQSVRGGVGREQIDRAARLLDAERDELRAHVEARLADLHPTGTKPLEWLARQPLVDRQDLREEVAHLKEHPPLERHEWRRTSGSTGTPFSLVKDMRMSAQMDATMWALYRWHGLSPGLPHARFWGTPRPVARRLRVKLADALLHRRRLDAFGLSGGRATGFFHRLRRFGPAYAYGYPSLIRAFLDECVEAGLDGTDLDLRVVITTGELLRDESRRLMEDFFDCPVVNEYGCTESGVLAFECESGTMHAIPVAAYSEVVAEDGDRRPPGEPGEVVVTDLYGETLPLVRYRLRDRGTRLDGGCPCGRALPVMRIDSGRIDDFIQTPARGPVYDAILAYTVPQGVQRFRAYQTAPDHLLVELVPGTGFDADRTPRECRRRWQEALGPGMVVTTRTVDDLAHEVSGKLRYFVPMDES